MTFAIKRKPEKDYSDADVLNEIEMRVRKGKPVSDREGRLLIESYQAFGVPIPKDIQRKLRL
jgi:hypothetical protein